MNSIIEVESLSKQYIIGARRDSYSTLRDALASAVRAPLNLLRRGEARQASEAIWAVKNLSFRVEPGEVVGIIGRNGAGKSTLLKILSQITEPTTGRVRLYGRVGSLLEVGSGFHPELTGRENIYLNGAILGMKRAEIVRKFDEIVGFAGVEKFLDTPVKRYSSGMYVRLAFAVAAHLEPEILVVDEVLAVGDVEFQKKCLSKMGDLSRSGQTVLLVSHNMASVANLCTRAILLNKGEKVMEGSASEVIQSYLAMARSAGGEAVWSDPVLAPGNEIARLHCVRIFQEGTVGATSDVDISKEVEVEITYWNLQEGALLHTGIWLRDHLGAFVLASSNHKSIALEDDPWYGRPHPVGLFKSICRIPGNFLNEGLYSITAIVGKDATAYILEDYVLSFNVHDTGEMRKEFLGNWIGVVRPRLYWHTEQLETNVEAVEYAS